MATLIDKYMVCQDCFLIIATGDATSLDYHYSEDEADQRLADIEAGIDALVDGHDWIGPGDSEAAIEFSRSACDCCDETLAGSRHEVIVLGK